MNYKRGDIVLVNFPYADLITVGKRPALVVQADNLPTGLTHLILAMITSRMKRAGPRCRVVVAKNDKRFAKTNLTTDSVVLADHLASVEQNMIEKKLGVIDDMTPIDSALRVSLSL